MYYFIGIKGSGMASLATILYDLGYEVKGSDISKYIFIEDELRKRHIEILDFDPANIKDGYHVIIGNAFGEDHLRQSTAGKSHEANSGQLFGQIDLMQGLAPGKSVIPLSCL